MTKGVTLTAALEDYLEAIFNLCRFDSAARSRDIAESLNVHKSTVTAALKSLGQMNLINYAPYEAVTLTPEGRRLAEDVARRHAALKDFFINVLRVEEPMAESAACGMEHSIPREIVHKLAMFASQMQGCPRLVEDDATAVADKACDACLSRADKALPTHEQITLDRVQPGVTVRIILVRGGGQVKKRITEMGLTRGALATVERIAPMGDPMDLKIRGYRLSLRKDEAARVVVEILPKNEE
ncbi:MAG: DtxR family transcriptional regulator [Planctomycetaceae bacterium]|nr:DtxR family transcriptional regulator [Planctomycetaceae bacterium]